MNSTQTMLINVLRQFVSGGEAALPKDADLTALFKQAGVHSLSAVVCYALNRQIISGGFEDALYAKELQKALFSTVMLQTERIEAFNKLLDILNKKGIPVILMKGSVIKRYYPEDTIRTFGDIDFLISHNSRDALHSAMVELGYDYQKTDDTVWTYVKGNEKYEVHTALLPNKGVLSKGMADFIDTAFTATIPTKRQNVFELEPSYHFAFLLLHLAKHMQSSGAGARMYLDLALMIKNEDKLDFKAIASYAKQLGLYDFLNSALLLCNSWFGTKPPIKTNSLEESAFEFMQEYVISGGVFGFYDRNPAEARLRQGKNSRLLAIIKFVFPPYREIQNAYKFLKGKPYLLPVFWVVRFFDGLLLRRKRAQTIFKGMFTEGQAAKKSQKMLNEIGIKERVK